MMDRKGLSLIYEKTASAPKRVMSKALPIGHTAVLIPNVRLSQKGKVIPFDSVARAFVEDELLIDNARTIRV
jgi:hypothetical protein